jgi:arylsulfatase A-like enzyme
VTITENLFRNVVWAIVIFASLTVESEFVLAQNRPNILIVLTDDVGWGDLRAFNPSSQLNLPTIDELSAQGMLFTDAHTSAAKCAPSRYSIITGNYQWRGRKNWGQWNYKGGSQILDGQLTVGHVLQQAGYKTAFIGKHHLGGEFFLKDSDDFASGAAPESDVDFSRQIQDGSLARGFDYSFVALRGIQDSPYSFFENDLLVGNASDLIHWFSGDYGDTKISKEGIGLPDWNTRDVGPTLLEKAVKFIDTHHSANVASGTSLPFFLYYNTQAVHYPLKPPIEIRGTPILGSTGVSDRADLIREIDEVLNILQTELAARGLLENTLVIFASDNGATRLTAEINLGHDANGGLRGSKGRIFEGGHRVPLIAKWGDGTAAGSPIQPGAVSNILVGAQDLYATIASLVGVDLEEDQGRDSFNMLPVLLGQSEAAIRDHMIHEADRNEDGSAAARHFAFREGNWKLNLDGSRNPTHLYNLANDLQETTNLINESSQAARIDQMLGRFTLLLGSNRSAPFTGNSLQRAPDFTSLPPGLDVGPPPTSAATQDVLYTYPITATDPDPSDTLTISGTHPAWLTLTDNGDGTATLSGTPTAADVFVADQTVALVVTDSASATDTQTFEIAIENVNDAPTFTSTEVTDADEGTLYTYDVTTEDLDNDAVTITAPTKPAWLTFTDNGDGTATLTGTPALADVGANPVVREVTDGTAAPTQQSFTITVTNVNDAPIFTSTPLVSATEAAAYSYTASASDPDGDSVTITAPTKPAWLTLTDNGNGTATLTGTPGGGDVGDHPIQLSADDGLGGIGTQSFTITVTGAGEGPVITLNGDANVTITEGDTYSDAGATASDPQDGDLTAQIVVDNPVNTGTPGTYTVTYTVQDSAGNQAQAQRTVVVGAAPPPPPPPPPPPSGGGGGGSLGLAEMLTFMLFGLVSITRRRRDRRIITISLSVR